MLVEIDRFVSQQNDCFVTDSPGTQRLWYNHAWNSTRMARNFMSSSTRIEEIAPSGPSDGLEGPSHQAPPARGEGQIILLMSALTYRAQPFREASQRLGLEVVPAIDMPQKLAEQWGVPLGVEFGRPEKAAQALVDYAQRHPVRAIMAVDDGGGSIAAMAAEALGLPGNSPEAASASRDKYEMRRLFARAGVPSPEFKCYSADDDPREIAREISAQAGYPVVLKPLLLSGSRGVIRADNPDELAAAFERILRILSSAGGARDMHKLLVEGYIPGLEVALEGIMIDGRLKALALFDKPDPLEGPFFEETIYVTPSRLPDRVQAQIAECAGRAAAALGLRVGPVHAELRVNDEGPWMLEIAARSIGGYCSKTLRFDMGLSLEELILRQAAGMEIEDLDRVGGANGVMMIPIPRAGILKGVTGVEAAEAVPGIDEVQITSPLNNSLVPLPEGSSYLGFIFASGEGPDFVEAALREAHRRLSFEIEEQIPLLHNSPDVIRLHS
jgi:formate-dependent phosphoribosylglycinamide formyltransferase (GAR transformylase)